MPTTTARHKVLTYLGERHIATSAQIGRALNMSAATVRHHLGILTADGRVAQTAVESRNKRGRPQKLYRLSDRLLGDNLGVLASALLTALKNTRGARTPEALGSLLAGELIRMVGPVDASLSEPKRLAELTKSLNVLHYQSRWEAGADGPRILFGHCPYAAIVAAHPELCKMDKAMLEMQMGQGVQQSSTIIDGAAGATQCVFVVRESVTARK